jgi:signal transduction histidine kinase/CheY-like chemotaxis protein
MTIWCYEASKMKLPGLSAIVGKRPLWFQLALLAAVVALPLLLASYVMFNRLVEDSRHNTKQLLLVNAKTLSGLVDNEIQTHIAIATTLAYSPALQKGNYDTFWQEATNAMKFVQGSSLDLADSEGNILLTTLQPAATPQVWKLPDEWVKAAFTTNSTHVSNLIQHGVSKKLAIIVTTPIVLDSKKKYILSISIPPERFLKLIETNFSNGQIVGIIDNNRQFVARIPDFQKRLGTLASEGWRAAIDAAPMGWTENKVVEGDWSMTGYAPTKYGWNVGVAKLEKDFQTPYQNILWTTLAASLLLAALGFLLAAAIAHHISKGIASIAQSAHDLGQGRPVEEFVAPFKEAQIVSHNLAAASSELDRRSHALTLANSELENKVAERTQSLESEMLRRQETETTLRQVQKIETIGQLTGGIAHDFNNMLTVIMGNLDTVQRRMEKLGDVAKIKQPVANALQGAKNAANLTQRLLAFSRQQALQPKSLALNSLVLETSQMLTRLVGEGISVETVLAAGLWQTFADANQVENALVNLVVNARDAMPDGGKLTIETSNAHLDDNYAWQFGDLKPGQYVLLSVTDQGTGIAPEKIEKVFEPFFTTKAPGKGTGLGLAMIYGFVKQSGGHIQIYSEVGEGTTVKIYLPRLIEDKSIPSHPKESPVEKTEIPRAKKGETVLLVEDDEGVRDYAVNVLKDLGYRVLAAPGADEALIQLKTAQHVDLLFTDVVLGGSLNGRQLADIIRKENTNLPVLFTTGYTRNAIIHNGRLDSGVNLLSKPYTQQDLAQKIRAAIDQR